MRCIAIVLAEKITPYDCPGTTVIDLHKKKKDSTLLLINKQPRRRNLKTSEIWSSSKESIEDCLVCLLHWKLLKNGWPDE